MFKVKKLFILCTVHLRILCRFTADCIPVALRRAHGPVYSAKTKPSIFLYQNSNNAPLSTFSELTIGEVRQLILWLFKVQYKVLHLLNTQYVVMLNTFFTLSSHLGHDLLYWESVSFERKFEPSGITITIIHSLGRAVATNRQVAGSIPDVFHWNFSVA